MRQMYRPHTCVCAGDTRWQTNASACTSCPVWTGTCTGAICHSGPARMPRIPPALGNLTPLEGEAFKGTTPHRAPCKSAQVPALEEPSLVKGLKPLSSTIDRKSRLGPRRSEIASHTWSSQPSWLSQQKSLPCLSKGWWKKCFLSSLNVNGHYQTTQVFSFLFSAIKSQTHT